MNTAFAYLSSVDLTDVGRRRKNNEDSLIRIPEAGLFCVADGMGGVQGGEIASKACVDALRKEFSELPDAAYAVTADASARLVERAMNAASKWVKERAESLGVNGTGSTAVVIAFDRVTPSQGMALHAGDSRAYRVRADKIVQLTADHSVAAAAGLPDDSTLPPMFRGVITRAVGLDRHIDLEATPFDVAAGDIFLLCSDGLSKMVSDKRIQKLVNKHKDSPLEDMAKALVTEALEAGGEDNVTVVLVRVADELPKGPTMEIPSETLALEELELNPPPMPAPQYLGDDHDATGQTADGDGSTASTMAEGRTPTTPDSMGKPAPPTTPVTPAEGRGSSPSKARYSPASRGLGGVFVVLALFAIVLAAVWAVLEWRALDRAGASKTVDRPSVLSTDAHHGAQE